jgi:hypothetical protein
MRTYNLRDSRGSLISQFTAASDEEAALKGAAFGTVEFAFDDEPAAGVSTPGVVSEVATVAGEWLSGFLSVFNGNGANVAEPASGRADTGGVTTSLADRVKATTATNSVVKGIAVISACLLVVWAVGRFSKKGG